MSQFVFQASDVRIIRVFISSTFTDTAQERNLLIADGKCLSNLISCSLRLSHCTLFHLMSFIVGNFAQSSSLFLWDPSDVPFGVLRYSKYSSFIPCLFHFRCLASLHVSSWALFCSILLPCGFSLEALHFAKFCQCTYNFPFEPLFVPFSILTCSLYPALVRSLLSPYIRFPFWTHICSFWAFKCVHFCVPFPLLRPYMFPFTSLHDSFRALICSLLRPYVLHWNSSVLPFEPLNASPFPFKCLNVPFYFVTCSLSRPCFFPFALLGFPFYCSVFKPCVFLFYPLRGSFWLV